MTISGTRFSEELESTYSCDVGCGSIDPDMIFESEDIEAVPSLTLPLGKKPVKCLRMSVSSIKLLMETHLNIYDLSIWRKCNRIIFQALSVDTSYNLGLFPMVEESALNSPVTYLEFLIELRRRFGISIYIGMPNNFGHIIDMKLKSDSEGRSSIECYESLCTRFENMLLNDGTLFFTKLANIMIKYDFDGCELNYENMNYVSMKLIDHIRTFPYRTSLMITLKPQASFVYYYSQIIKTLSRLIECFNLNSYGYFKYDYSETNGMYDLRIGCECSLEDFHDLIRSYYYCAIPSWKLVMNIGSCGILFISKSDSPDHVHRLMLIPYSEIEQIRNDGTWIAYQCKEDVEEDRLFGCILKNRYRAEYLSYDNSVMKIMKFRLCAEQNFSGVVCGSFVNDLPLTNDWNLINLMNKYIN